MKEIFQLFGSKSSEDYDVIIFVDEIPNIADAKLLCKNFDKLLYMKFVDAGMKIKKLNSNIAILKNGIITDVYKGTADEVNNSLYLTYNLHKQFFPNQIEKLVERDIDIKIMRASRFMLMYLSRTEHRFEVKRSLKSNFIKKIKTLENIDLSNITQLGDKSINWHDYLKSMSFQILQSLSLMDGLELYTKEELCEYCPDLQPMLMRTGQDLKLLEKYKIEFVRSCKIHLKKMKTFDEY